MKILNIPLAKSLWHFMVKHYPKLCCKLLYRKALGKKLNFKSPLDLNEKIQWLKFHADMKLWARLADKYAVREYVKGKGLENILVNLYGKYDTSDKLLEDWDNLPNKFILKSNNGCGTVKIIKDKNIVDKIILKAELDKWLVQKDIGLGTIELHYTLIKPCIIAEELLEDKSVETFSRSLIDYKIWCFNGEPFCCAAIYDRDINTHTSQFDLYDINWKPMRNHVTHLKDRHYKLYLPKPKNWEQMLDIARILTNGHPEVRMDLYNINGRILFGEMTFTAKGGLQDDYSDDLLLKMGNMINL